MRLDGVISELGGPDGLSIYVTGHSLGGALASLAALDIKKAHPTAHMTVYTYGQPRVGNPAFVYEYNKLVDEHFSVVSGQDPVSRQPKGNYKRVGDRVLLDKLGNVIFRPTYLEMHLMNKLGEPGRTPGVVFKR